MKITDYCIIFAITAMCFITVITKKSDIAYEQMYINNRYNVVVDNAVEDALRAAYERVDENGSPVVNLETASGYLLDEISVMFDGDKMLKEYYYDRIKILIYTSKEGYYCYDKKEGWSDIILYSEKEKTSHQDKINNLLKFIKSEYGVELAVPYNDGESYENSIDDYSFIAVYKGYDDIYCFSAAKIEYKKVSTG